MSSHPGALMALSRALGPGLEALDLSFIRTRAQNVLATCPVEYISRTRVRGVLFADHPASAQDEGRVDEDGSVCVADSGFWVDHTEPMGVLAGVRMAREWPFGELSEGCEWLVLVKSSQENNERGQA